MKSQNAIPVLGIPHYNRPDLLARCIASIDYPVEKLVIVNNGPDRVDNVPEHIVDPVGHVGEVIYISHPNAGVAGAWNEIIKLCPAPWWMISNNDIQFTPGDLEKMADAAWRESRAGTPMGKLFGNHGASWFVVTQFGIHWVGLYDENIYPAYLEDCDWHYRAKLLGVRTANVEGVNAIHGDGKLTGSCTVNSDPVLRDKNVQTHSRNFGYYEAKWGGRNGQEKFKSPFNDPSIPVWSWKYFPDFRREQQW